MGLGLGFGRAGAWKGSMVPFALLLLAVLAQRGVHSLGHGLTPYADDCLAAWDLVRMRAHHQHLIAGAHVGEKMAGREQRVQGQLR